MTTEEKQITLSSSFEEGVNRSHLATVGEGFSADLCSAECPTCQEKCTYTDGHQGLHLCPKGHEWVK